MRTHILLSLLCVVGPLHEAHSAEKPNIVVVFIDDMGYSDFSCFGGAVETQHVDRLAAEGIKFTNFYVNSPICSPSRVALTTGQYPHRHRITSYLNNRRDNKRRGMAQWLDPKAPTLARRLKAHGYATGHFGKWHMGGQRDVDDAPPITDYGFDKSLTNFEGMGPKLLPLTLKPGQDPTKPGRIWAKAERLGEGFQWMQRSEITTGFVDAALTFIDQARAEEKPFYINLWPDDVHGPFWPPLDKWGGDKRALYQGVLDAMDEQFARLFDRVRNDPKLRDNTLITICSDNGHEPGAGTSRPFRGAKTWMYEGGIRSPLIVWAPGLIDAKLAGTTNDNSVFCALDLNRTLYRIAGTQPVEKLDGEDLAATLLGQSKQSRDAPIFWRRPPDRPGFSHGAEEDNPDLAVRHGRWKYLVNHDGSDPQLYDLPADPGETSNLAAANPQMVARLDKALRAWNATMPVDGSHPEYAKDGSAQISQEPASATKPDRSRLIILADMGNEPDEEQQMAHMLLNANEFDLEGLIAVSGKYLHAERRRPERQKLRPDLFHKLIDAYSEVLPNMKLHAGGWPSPEYLHRITCSGQERYGTADVGDGKSTSGSKLIIEALRKEDPRPIWMVVNAGSNTLAQALHDLRKEDPNHLPSYVAKLRVFENGAQDNAGAWICSNFPEIHWIRSNYQTYAYGGPGGRGGDTRQNIGPHFWKPFPYSVEGQHDWLKKHAREEHGALGEAYPERRFGNGRLAFMEGGGTIPWLGLVNKGLFDINHPSWGGWSGRFTKNKVPNFWSRHGDIKPDEEKVAPFSVYREASDVWTDPDSGETYHGDYVPVWRWRPAMYANFICRMDWCVAPFAKANHHPVAALKEDTSDTVVRLSASAGEHLEVDASASTDPDDDKLTFRWWPYQEAGTYPGQVHIESPHSPKSIIHVPTGARGTQIHVILEVRDENPIASLYDYRRVVIDVEDKIIELDSRQK